MKLSGKVALITGASRGFGKAALNALITEGASALILARDTAALEAAKAEALKLAPDKTQAVECCGIDVTNRASVDKAVEKCISRFGKIDILLNNAGVYGTKGEISDIDMDEWIHTIEINLYGPIYFMRAAIPYMKKQGGGKILNMSGGGATSPLPYLSSYAASKAAIVRLTETVSQELAPYNIDVNAIAPGAMNTRMLDEIIEAGPQRVGEKYYAKALAQKADGGAPIDISAKLVVFLASAESDGISGKLISAVWDPWQNLAQYKDALMGSDIYALRRIVPKERGLDWS